MFKILPNTKNTPNIWKILLIFRKTSNILTKLVTLETLVKEGH